MSSRSVPPYEARAITESPGIVNRLRSVVDWAMLSPDLMYAAAVSKAAVPGWTAAPGTGEVPSFAGKVSLSQRQESTNGPPIPPAQQSFEIRNETLSK